MSSMAVPERGSRLSRGWRRLLVVLLAGCVGTMILMHLLVVDRPEVLYGATLILVVVAGACVWLLLDLLRPWVGGQAVSAEERAQADSAVRRSYTILLWTAVGVLVYLNVAGGRPGLAADQPHHGTVILWSAVALVFLLPLVMAAWDDVDSAPGERTVGPIALAVERFRGPSGGTYLAGAVAFAVGAGVLVIWSGAFGAPSDRLMNGTVVAALGIVTVLIVVQLKGVLTDRGGKGHGGRR